MKNVRLLHVCLITLLSSFIVCQENNNAYAQANRRGGIVSGPKQPRGKPFVDIHGQMPKEVMRKPLRNQGRAVGATPQTVDITPKTDTIIDSNPLWPKSQNAIGELPVVFQSNRVYATGDATRDPSQATPGTKFHVFMMLPDGSSPDPGLKGPRPLTGPQSTGAVGASNDQTEPAFNQTANSVVYVETDSSGIKDIIELNINTNTVRSLVKNNTDVIDFIDLGHPEYGVVPGGNIGIIFAGKSASTAGGFHIYAVDTQSGHVVRLTSGACDDRNPTLSPDPLKPIIAFDSNRADANGNSVKASRDIWAVDANHPLSPATRMTFFLNSENIQPSWSTNSVDQPTGTQHIVNGIQLLGFATTRRNTNPAAGPNATDVNPNGTHDVYWLKIWIDADVNDPVLFRPYNYAGVDFSKNPPVPDGSKPVEDASNPGFELITSDPQHIYDDTHPTWPQFITTYRITYQTNRKSYDPNTNTSIGTTLPLTDIFSSTLVDLNSPTLVRIDDLTGDVLRVEPRITSPGSPVKISVSVSDLESGVRDVWVQIKNPNSLYQSSDGKEHKVFAFATTTPDSTNGYLSPIEYESEPIFIGPVSSSGAPTDPRGNTYPRTGAVNRAHPPSYITSIDDLFAYSGIAHPPTNTVPNANPPDPTKDTGFLQLKFERADPQHPGANIYSATWQTDIHAADYYVDVIVYDNALNPFTRAGVDDAGVNWKIYDNVWGFSTQTFNPAHNILFVSDYAAGQKFFNSRFGVNTLVNVFNSFWGTESWMTDIDVSLYPRTYLPLAGGTAGTVLGFENTLGANSYSDFLADDGTFVGNPPQPLPPTQAYDLWRILCRGPVEDSVLSQYTPITKSQPADVVGGEDPKVDRKVLVASRCVVWHSPFTGDVFAGPGTLSDLAVQFKLHSFLQAGGRLLVNGQDIGWALTLDSPHSTSNSFYTGDLKGDYNTDSEPNTLYRTGLFGFPGFLPFIFWLPSISNAYAIAGTNDYDPISADPWHEPGYIGLPGHSFPGPPIPPNYDPPNLDTEYISGGESATPTFRNDSSPGVAFPDTLGGTTTAIIDFGYFNTKGNAIHAAQHYADPTTNSRVVYYVGLEGISNGAYSPGGSLLLIKPRRAQLMHNAVCWMRTGTVVGAIIDVNGGAPLPDALVRLSRTQDPNKAGADKRVFKYTGLTAGDGTYSIEGVEPGIYEVTAVKPGFTIQKATFVITHGGYRGNVSIRMTKAEPADIKGKVTKLDGTSAIPGAVVTATDVVSRTVPAPSFTATTDVDGNYDIQRVPSQTIYKLTVVGPKDPVSGQPLFGASIPDSYPVPNPNDPIVTQRDTVVQASKTYAGFDFKLKSSPGNITGKVVDKDTKVGIGGAVVTATASNNATTPTTTQADGTFTLSNLDSGPYGLVATAPGYAPNVSVSITVQPNQTVALPANIELTKVAPGSISGLVTRTSDNGVLEGVTITLKDGAGNTIVTGTTGPVQTGANNYRFNYKLDNVPAGVTYTVTASKSGFTPIPVSQPAAVATAVETQNINFQMDPLHTFTGQLSLVSAPYDYPNNDVGDLLAIPLADRSNQTFLFATWDLGGYIFYPSQPANTFHLGRGYFMKYKNNLPLSIQGTSPDPNGFDIPLNPGWNLIGCPYTFDIDWTRLAIVYNGVSYPHDDATHATPAHPVLIGDALYTFVSGGYVLDFKLSTWKGYWVRAFTNCVIHINPATDKFGRSASVPGAGRAVLGGGDGWSLNLRLSAGGMKDTDNYIGVSSRAVDTYDRYKAMKPPVFGDRYTYLSIANSNWAQQSGAYGVDIRSNSPALKTWTIEAAASTPNATATLSWPNAATIGRNATLVLTDLATGQVRDMRNSSGYTWQTGDKPVTRQFKIEAARTDRAGTLYVSGIAAQQSPGRSTGLSVNYSLSVPADVEVRILGGNGQLVRRLGSRATRAAGVNEAVWDLKNDKGVSMPAGAYIVEIRAQAGKNTVRAAQPVLVVR